MSAVTAVRTLAGAVVAAATLCLAAAPAAAHGDSGPDATNYETVLEAVTPATPGIEVRLIDLGERIEVRNTTASDVVVLGYGDEPYLRVGPDGVFENRRSPATYLNRSLEGDTDVPDSADPEAPPQWRRVNAGDTVSWHDHRTHWMADRDPPVVREDRGSRHSVQPWTVELRHEGETMLVTGDVVWVPPPSPWPWLVAALVLAAAVVGASRLRHWRAAIIAALVVAMIATVAHIAGEWGASTASVASTLGSSIYTIGGVALGIVAVVLLAVRRDPADATPAVLMATLVLALGTGLAGISSWWHSQLPSTQAADLVRLEVAAVLGLGVGLAAAAALRLRGPGAAAAATDPQAVRPVEAR
jgi:hypothetical protein